ncbi:MAG: serine/threonine protein kinase [Pseudomonadales bacterium]|uniref:formylglycine-generating enzyme family protein n=1 Tax=unclassified Ketobacter TaxID=2639109 RepID=UPI000C611FF2|nr:MULTISPECIES: SUMF1/EgtB/PvdO family nonheme iron enzyme [unclassified Ketobacter]MAQ23384.1 serine/threonine protein kinase [Pseudomonadales bacterium]MEC8812562.1 SUMF1/EgtB/PvdO family nonheme iron enzyme [Pseudomonadota bacterium]TNC86773.1 MAG: serine/threonine protein kinase [Alcanivorax sp.]HAG96348.1 serine/threonine protein kinase [Gammaproteobacteria bacterium]MBI27532.1 serine/threonine protein kinase [Pseudomonadales bacterium]|tara:strand:+ start:4279 stop:5301 length:1023 start_codon:yes stop_codon:yes gene_type:complete
MSEEYCLTGFRLLNSSISHINSVAPEKAMNLPDYFQSNDVEHEQTALHKSLKSELPRYLSVLESAECSFEERYLAASVINALGDPRIQPLDPSMVDIPASTFRLGITAEKARAVAQEFADIGVLEEWILKETPETDVALSAFRIGRYPVTNLEYKRYMDENKYAECPPYWRYKVFPAHLANHPVHSISIDSINAYINWLNQTTGRAFRLPTEPEWEFAAKGPCGLEYPWGNQYQKDCANTLETGLINTTPVGLFPKGRSPFGCLDMAGNVEEYTSSFYFAYQGDALIQDDLYVENGPYQVARGGSYMRFRDLARTTRRHGRYDSELYVMGFRLAEDIRRN